MEQETTITFKCTNEEKKQMKKIAKEKHLTLENLIKRNKELEEMLGHIEKFRDNNISNEIDYVIALKSNFRPYLKTDYISKSKVREKIEEYNDKLAEQIYIIKEFGEHKGNREKATMYKDYRDAYAELLQEGDDK